MEENTAAVECLILFYINTKHVLKTKQLDERVFLDQMIRHCKENGFDTYSIEEIRSTWKNLTSKFVELKKTGSTEEKQFWKYYEILDSCYEQSDFHNGVYPKFSEEMVWFLIECFLKRKGLEKTQKKHSMLHEIHKDFLQSGYLYITRQDIENKWKYLNIKYDKLKDDPDSLNKLPYLQALKGYREKDSKRLVRMIFTRELTEILIERFTEKKITCVIHGYDSEQVLNEIQAEFRDLGFDFSQEEINDRWAKLINIYTFLKAKGRYDSSWIYFNAMREHFKDDFLFGIGKVDNERKDGTVKPLVRQRSKSVGADARIRYTDEIAKTKLVVNIEQLNKDRLSSSLPERLSEGKKKRAPKRKTTQKSVIEVYGGDLQKSPKKPKVRSRSKSRENSKKNKNKDVDIKKEKIRKKFPEPLFQGTDSTSVKKGNQLKKLSIDRNGNQERRSSTDLGSPASKVHIINIDESKIDKKSGNLTINLPSITKQFSDNEFLPLKKRLRVGKDNAGEHPDDEKDIKDGFLGFPRIEDANRIRTRSVEAESKRLTEEEMAEIMERISQDTSDKYGTASNIHAEDKSHYRSEEVKYAYQGPYDSFKQPCLLVPKEEQQDNLPLESYNSNTMTPPPPVLLLVIKVDGSNNPIKDGVIPDDEKHVQQKIDKSPAKNEPVHSNKSSEISKKNEEFVKPLAPRTRSCTVTQGECTISKQPKTNDINYSHHGLNKPVSSNNVNTSIIQNENIVAVQNTEVKNNEGNLQIKHNISMKVNNNKSCPITLNNDKVVTNQSPEMKHKEIKDAQNTPDETSKLDIGTSIQNLHSPEKATTKDSGMQAVPTSTAEKCITVPPAQQQPNRIRLPVKGGGKLKEIYISPRELSKLTKVKPADFKTNSSPTKPVDGNLTKNKPEINTPPCKPPPKFKYISQVIKPPIIQTSPENKLEKTHLKPTSKVNLPNEPVSEVNGMLPPSTVIGTTTKFMGTNNSAVGSRKNEEFENESVFSEAVGDDDCIKDNLLATVIDFQEQNNQEFVEIKNLMKQNNLLQRETNRLLRLMLEKM